MKRHFKRAAASTLALVGIFTAVALAWFAIGIVDGTGTGKTGAATLTNIPIKVSFPDGAVPGAAPTAETKSCAGCVPLTMKVENTVPGAIEFEISKLAFAITNSKEGSGCANSNFSVHSKTFSNFWEPILNAGAAISPTIKVKANETTNEIGAGDDAVLVLASAAPTACEATEVKVHVTATHTP